ncbi:flagellar motor switch protein FliM [Anaerotignum neopropionicum]|uniref:Flagellar motor switch protein FliM n=1 Tax=Anaerotignum neopropionicum TaxID=36847 RepID=A0A136WJ99_9FIRM|nr:FliM/FliN family flagellar motor switch protein [Anaerotignum neopropionicum]KXL54544.1 flagellar motor switch protein FliM [Anaerotignum neopropionicum]
MSEVLSQSQIDALLASVMGGGTVKEEVSKDAGKNYRKYDFYSPKKFTKDKLNILRSAYENYCRMTSSRLNSLLRISSEVSLVTVEEERYYEFSNALSDNDALTMIRATLGEKNGGGTIFMHVTTPLMLSMIDRMLGGKGEEPEYIPSQYSYTDIELLLYENIAKYLVAVMKDGWANYLDMNFAIEKVETSHGLMQEIGMDEIVVIVVIEVKIQGVEGKINVCIPGTLLTNIFSFLEHKKSSSGKAAGGEEDNTSQDIFEFIKDSNLEVTAKIGDATVMLQDIYDLKQGDIINMNRPQNSYVDVFVENNIWFQGKLGTQNKNMAVRISEINKQKDNKRGDL